MSSRIQEMFEQAGCAGQLSVLSLGGMQEVAVDADRSVVTASVFKVSVALEAETQFADGRLDPRERVTLPAAMRTPGPVGFSLFRDDVEVSLQDLVVAMLTISDNDATDALLDRVGIEAVNISSVRLGLADTVITADLRTVINSIGHAAGFADWDAMQAWAAQPHSSDEEHRVVRCMTTADALAPERTTRTTPRDMATLLRLIWSDQEAVPGIQALARRVSEEVYIGRPYGLAHCAYPPTSSGRRSAPGHRRAGRIRTHGLHAEFWPRSRRRSGPSIHRAIGSGRRHHRAVGRRSGVPLPRR
jgi:beta-lactamase class A